MSGQTTGTNPLIRKVQLGRGRQPKAMTPEAVLWLADCMQALGWKSRAVEQQQTYDGLKLEAESVIDRSMRGQGDQSAVSTEYLLKDSGKEFKDYHAKRAAFEKAQPRTAQMADELRLAAENYIAHFNLHGKRQQEDSKNIAKRDACLATLADLRRLETAESVADLPPPPWDTVTSMQAASLRTQLALSSLPPGKQRASDLGPGHDSPAFWVEQKGFGPDGKSKTYIFKPISFSREPGFPHNGEPAREAIAARVSDMLTGALGFSVPMPQTQIVTVAQEQLDQSALDDFVKAGTPKMARQPSYSGSVQSVVATKGSARKLLPGEKAALPVRATQELAVLDILTLNTDRHSGNLLLQDDGNGGNRLVPIDHGLCFPGTGAQDRIATKMGSRHNVLLEIPGAHEPFDPQVLASIQNLQPEVIAETLKRERQTLAEAHPDTDNTLTDESIEFARRSGMFLKLAAPLLSPAAIQIALARHNRALFDLTLDDNGFTLVANRVIAEAEEQAADIKEFFGLPREVQDQIEEDLARLGWKTGRWSREENVMHNPALALRMWKANIAPPNVARDPNVKLPPAPRDAPAQMQAIQQAFPKTVLKTTDDLLLALTDWADWNRLGGTKQKLEDAATQFSLVDIQRAAAMGDVTQAVTLLKKAASVVADVDGAAGNGDVALLRAEADYLAKLQPLLPAQTQAQLLRILEPIQSGLSGRTPMSDAALGQARTTLSRMRTALQDAAGKRVADMLNHYEEVLLQKRQTGQPLTNIEAGYLSTQIDVQRTNLRLGFILLTAQEVLKWDPTLANI